MHPSLVAAIKRHRRKELLGSAPAVAEAGDFWASGFWAAGFWADNFWATIV